MDEESEFEEFADMAINELREFINTEQQFVEEEHELHAKLLSWDYIILHLNEKIPENMTHLHRLIDEISDKLMEIRDLLESGRLHDLKLVQEEKPILAKLKAEAEHKNWRAVRMGVDLESKEEKRVLRLEKSELKELHHKFISLMKLMNRSNLIDAIGEDLSTPKQKNAYVDLVDYYFLQIYKFIRAYERIFRHLWRKESSIAREVHKASKRMN